VLIDAGHWTRLTDRALRRFAHKFGIPKDEWGGVRAQLAEIHQRVWQWDAVGLKSLNGELWLPGQRLSATCRADRLSSISGLRNSAHDAAELPGLKCTCGVYAAKNIKHLNQCGYSKFAVRGEVFMWGRVVEHERGWRAEFAYPKSMVLLPAAIPFSLSAIDARLKPLTVFGTDIFIQLDHELLPLWKNSSGYDAAGLDYLIRARREHYLRRQSERTLREGDRVTLLGVGIAVVREADGNTVRLALGSRRVLRVARKNITLDDRELACRTEGAKNSRPQLNELMAAARKRQVDAIVVWRFDRFARSTKHLLLALEEFRSLGIQFTSYSENIDTSSPLGQSLFTIVSAVAQLERDLIRERVKAGLRNAKLKGKTLGRPTLTLDRDRIARLRASGSSIRDIAAQLEVSTATVHKALRGR